MNELITLRPGFTFYHTSPYNTHEAKERHVFEYDMGDTPYGELDLHNSLLHPKYFGLLDVYPYAESVIRFPKTLGMSQWTTHTNITLVVVDDVEHAIALKILEETGADGWLRYDESNNLWYEAYILKPYLFMGHGIHLTGKQIPSIDKLNYDTCYPLEYRRRELVKLMTYSC